VNGAPVGTSTGNGIDLYGATLPCIRVALTGSCVVLPVLSFALPVVGARDLFVGVRDLYRLCENGRWPTQKDRSLQAASTSDVCIQIALRVRRQAASWKGPPVGEYRRAQTEDVDAA